MPHIPTSMAPLGFAQAKAPADSVPVRTPKRRTKNFGVQTLSVAKHEVDPAKIAKLLGISEKLASTLGARGLGYET